MSYSLAVGKLFASLLKKYCQKEAKIIFTIKNFCDIHNRIKILNGELDNIRNKNIFNLKTINQLINNLGYCIQQMDRVKIDELKLKSNIDNIN